MAIDDHVKSNALTILRDPAHVYADEIFFLLLLLFSSLLGKEKHFFFLKGNKICVCMKIEEKEEKKRAPKGSIWGPGRP